MTTLQLVHNVFECVVGVLSIVFNIWLLYLIKNHSKFGSNFYRVMLAIDALLDLTLATFVFLGQPASATLIGDGYKLYFSAGLFAGRSRTLDKVLLGGWLCFLHYNLMWVPVQFVYRYAFVCLRTNSKQSKRVLRRLAFLSAVYALVGTLFCINESVVDEPHGLRVIQQNDWPLDEPLPAITGGHISELRTKLWVLMWAVSALGGAVVVLIFEIKIAKSLKNAAGSTNRTTQKMHVEFHRALLAMAICPIVTSSVPIIFFLTALITGLNLGPCQVFLTMGVSAITFFNPLTTMYFMRSYRDAILATFGFRKARSVVGPMETRVTGLSVGPTTPATEATQSTIAVER